MYNVSRCKVVLARISFGRRLGMIYKHWQCLYKRRRRFYKRRRRLYKLRRRLYKLRRRFNNIPTLSPFNLRAKTTLQRLSPYTRGIYVIENNPLIRVMET